MEGQPVRAEGEAHVEPQGAEGGQGPLPLRAAEGRAPEVVEPQGAEGGVSPASRCRGRSIRKEPCPCSTCDVRARRTREHAVGCHLPLVFRVTVPRSGQADCIRVRAPRWLAKAVLGRGGGLMRALVESLTLEEVFGQRPPPWPESFIREIEDLCRFVEEAEPAVWHTRGTLHPAMLLHWRVQCHILDALPRVVRDEYVGLLAGEFVGSHRLANYPNRRSGSSSTPGRERRRRRGLSLGPRPASGTPMECEPLWDRDLGETFPPGPEETPSPSGPPETQGGRVSLSESGSDLP
jgi:hypothetical protein